MTTVIEIPKKYRTYRNVKSLINWLNARTQTTAELPIRETIYLNGKHFNNDFSGVDALIHAAYALKANIHREYKVRTKHWSIHQDRFDRFVETDVDFAKKYYWDNSFKHSERHWIVVKDDYVAVELKLVAPWENVL